MKQRIISLLLCVVLLVSMSACDTTANKEKDDNHSQKQDAEIMHEENQMNESDSSEEADSQQEPTQDIQENDKQNNETKGSSSLNTEKTDHNSSANKKDQSSNAKTKNSSGSSTTSKNKATVQKNEQTTNTQSNSSTASSTTSKKGSNSTTNTKPATESNTQNNTQNENSDSSGNKSNSDSTPSPTYKTFDKSIGIYESKDLPSISTYYDNWCPAWIGIYSIGKSASIESEIKQKFKDRFGYEAKSAVSITLIGQYLVDGYEGAKDIYQYSIEDFTYPLFDEEFYVITKKICDDGSPWVGFAMPGTLDTHEGTTPPAGMTEKMNQIFREWTGYDEEYIRSHPENFKVSIISQAGFVRTKDGKVLEIIYWYTRAYNLPINT